MNSRLDQLSNFSCHWTVFILLFFITLPGRHTSSLNILNQKSLPSGTVPPVGSLIVRQVKPLPGEFSTIPQAIRSLRGTKGKKTIFIYPGSYTLSVFVDYGYPLTIMGYTSNRNTYAGNRVTVSVATGAAQSGGDSQSSAIWIKQNDFKMFNINVVNSYGTGTDTQAVALTAEGERHVYSMCSFSSYQDTLYVKAKSAYFIECNIEGTVDVVFGRGNGWFERANIVVKPPQHFAAITAHRGDGSTKFVFNRSNIVGASGVGAGSAYLGRPWSNKAAVTFQFCSISDVINPAGWAAWNPTDPRTDSVQFYEYQNQGPGSRGTRSFGKLLTQPAKIEEVLGSDYSTWAAT